MSESFAATITRPSTDEYAPSYAGYVAKVPDGDVVATMAMQILTTHDLLVAVDEGRGGYRYAPDKWSLREVVGHMADTERVMTYRALRFARADPTPLAAFDENAYIPPSGFGDRTLASVLAEFESVRAASVALFGGLPDAAWTRGGQASGKYVSVRALAWIVAGHERHHLDIIRERYL